MITTEKITFIENNEREGGACMRYLTIALAKEDLPIMQ